MNSIIYQLALWAIAWYNFGPFAVLLILLSHMHFIKDGRLW